MREYRILADERSAEDLSDLFLEKGALAASLEDADADSTDEAPLYGEPGLEPETCAWPRSIISVLTADDCHFKNLLDDCVKELGLCLNWLDENIKSADRVLDYGCGTGILAIGAKKLGAAEVCGTDIDPQAVEAARDNAIRNDVEAQFWLPADMPEGTFSIVVANILANPLKLLAPALLGRVAAHGALVLSGVLARQADEVIAVYKAADPTLVLSVWREEDGWVCLAGRRA